MPLEAFDEPAGFGRGEGFVQRGRFVGFEVVLDQHDFLDLAKVFVGDLAQHVSVIDGGSLVGHLDPSSTVSGLGRGLSD